MRHRDFLRRCFLGLCLCGLSLLLPGRVNAGTLEDDIQAELRAIREHRAVEAMREVWDIEAGELAEDATDEALEEAKDLMEALHAGAVKDDLAEMAAAAFREMNRPANVYYGNCRVTFYCAGSCCCGQWATGYTASGTRATAGRTVACGDLPFGTRIEIDGQEYIVEDRGVGAQQIDIFVNTHGEAVESGLYYADVYVISD